MYLYRLYSIAVHSLENMIICLSYIHIFMFLLYVVMEQRSDTLGNDKRYIKRENITLNYSQGKMLYLGLELVTFRFPKMTYHFCHRRM